MRRLYGKFWWSFLVRGILAVLFGTAAIVVPGITLGSMAILLAFFLIADGIFSFIASLKGRVPGSGWGYLLVEGIIGIAVGLLTLLRPGVTVLAIVLIIAFWAVLTGILELLAAIRLRNEIKGEWLLGLGGVVSILLGLLFFANPGIGAIAMTWMIGVYALVFGISLIFLGFRLRNHREEINI